MHQQGDQEGTHNVFGERRSRVLQTPRWLKQNNPFYPKMAIDADFLRVVLKKTQLSGRRQTTQLDLGVDKKYQPYNGSGKDGKDVEEWEPPSEQPP